MTEGKKQVVIVGADGLRRAAIARLVRNTGCLVVEPPENIEMHFRADHRETAALANNIVLPKGGQRDTRKRKGRGRHKSGF